LCVFDISLRVSSVGGDQRELLLSEGTVILHITFALKQDQELGKEFLKVLKVIPNRLSASSLSPFTVALAMSVVRIHRFEDAVFDCLKTAILKSFKDQDRVTASRWIETVSGECPDLGRSVLRTVEHSKCGWDHVVEGLVMLGFHLMDTCAPKTSNPQLSSPQYRVCSLGSRILCRCFKVHSIVHGEVISQLINRILTNASTYVTHYIALLSEVIEMTPQVALDSLPRLREAFSYLSVLPPSSATDLLDAVLPLVQFSSSVRDSLLLVLRKSLFSRQVDVRKIAVGGYLLLLKKFTVWSVIGGIDSQLSQTSTSSQSQVEVEIHGSASQSGFQALCLELLGTLKRSLSQQYEVKITLYQGLYEVLCTNSKLAEPIIELLLTQLMVYYEKESDATPPVRLEPCITTSGSEVQRTEPLDRLVHCLQMCVTEFVRREEKGAEKGAESDGLPEPVEEAREVLESLVGRMTDTHLDDFELDRSADFSTGSSVGQKNRIFAKLVMGLYEV
jgi:Fanconi anemia group I protein